MDYKNYKSWHIPRASLSSGSNSGQSSTESMKNFERRQSDVVRNHLKDGSRLMPSSNSSSASSLKPNSRQNRDRQNSEKIHRGSRSSQGSSTDGINSLHSASSLLLSVANLENFTKMQESRLKHEWTNKAGTQPIAESSHFMINMTNVDETQTIQHQQKAKDFDQVSIASSTHFTVVNGFGRSNIKPKSNSICRQGRQITILIMTMSILFMIGILGAIYLMDKRAKSMPAYHQ